MTNQEQARKMAESVARSIRICSLEEDRIKAIANALLQFHQEQESVEVNKLILQKANLLLELGGSDVKLAKASEAVRELVDGLKEIQTASSDEAIKATPTLKHWTLAKTCSLIAAALIAKHSKGAG